MSESKSRRGTIPKSNICGRLELIVDSIESAEELRFAAADEVGPIANRLKRKKRNARNELYRLLDSIRPGGLSRLIGLSKKTCHDWRDEWVLLLVLLNQRVKDSEPFVCGRDLLWLVADSTFELTTKSQLLRDDASLLQSGLIMVYQDPDEDMADLLNRHYAMDSSLFHRLIRSGQNKDSKSNREFEDATEHFLSFVELVEEAQLRAAKAFDIGIWREMIGEPLESIGALQSRLDESWRVFDRRLHLTDHAERFPFVKFRREFMLTDAECVIVVALLAQEAFVGSTSVEALDLLRLVSSTPRGLLRRRRILSPRGRLMQFGILIGSEAESAHAVPGEIALAPWVVERLLVTHIGPDSEIASDERIEFHTFLAGLSGSDEFYDKL